ncbi:hypothetical protein EVAR_33981_1 [Eumeta japonica]|uniref:Uncharacterized protein n=1 Tax=Eumeta variegata TaxID=151549 RepID=A0A4C1X3J4_EUMVA|nr:hypothetical protein EVAR_33981_1 [Eumeta japonica]
MPINEPPPIRVRPLPAARSVRLVLVIWLQVSNTKRCTARGELGCVRVKGRLRLRPYKSKARTSQPNRKWPACVPDRPAQAQAARKQYEFI